MKKAKSIVALLLALLVVVGCSMSAFAAVTEGSETEINDTPETANNMGLSYKMKGHISKADDIDYYKFEVTTPSLVYVTLEHSTISGASSTYFVAEVLNSNGDTVSTLKSKGTDAKISTDPFAAEAGVFYIKVTMGQILLESLEYTVCATPETAAYVETEPNDIVSKATPLQLSTSGNKKQYYGSISSSVSENGVVVSDVDYYSISIPSPGAVYFYLYNGTATKGEYKATFYAYLDGANGVATPKSLGSITINANQSYVMSPSVGVNGGNYILKIEGVNGSIGGYQTRVYYLSDSTTEYEYNNVKEYANLIGTSGKTYGSVFDANDVDFYRFTASKGNNGFTIKFNLEDSDKKTDGQWTVSLVDSNGSVVAKVDATNTKAAEITTEALNAGVHYIVIEAGNVANSGIYSISLTANAAKVEDKKDDDKSFFDKIKDLPWGDFADNFNGWFEKIDVGSIISSITASIVTVLTYLFALGN